MCHFLYFAKYSEQSIFSARKFTFFIWGLFLLSEEKEENNSTFFVLVYEIYRFLEGVREVKQCGTAGQIIHCLALTRSMWSCYFLLMILQSWCDSTLIISCVASMVMRFAVSWFPFSWLGVAVTEPFFLLLPLMAVVFVWMLDMV